MAWSRTSVQKRDQKRMAEERTRLTNWSEIATKLYLSHVQIGFLCNLSSSTTRRPREMTNKQLKITLSWPEMFTDTWKSPLKSYLIMHTMKVVSRYAISLKKSAIFMTHCQMIYSWESQLSVLILSMMKENMVTRLTIWLKRQRKARRKMEGSLSCMIYHLMRQIYWISIRRSKWKSTQINPLVLPKDSLKMLHKRIMEREPSLQELSNANLKRRFLCKDNKEIVKRSTSRQKKKMNW